MAHHGHGLTATASARVAFLGMPNTGKSTLFSALSGHHAHIGNWPGLTVDLMAATVTWEGHPVELVDLPGLYDLRGLSEDEAVVRGFLETTPLQLLVVVLNASQVDRQLRLALQVKALGLPLVVALNMADEAGRFGVKVDCERLARTLGVPVLPISAKHRRGLGSLRRALQEATGPDRPPCAPPSSVVECLPEEDGALPAALEAVLRQTVELPGEWQDRLSRRLDRVLLHPWLGLPLFFLAMALLFQAVYAIGAPIQEQLTTALDGFGSGVLRPALAFLPDFWRHFVVDGLYQGIGTVAAFLPVIFLFFLAMGVVEDSGYLSRSAFLMDALMERLGLDGRSFVLSLMGFGCNVPAILGTRVMRSRGLRLLTMLIIPFSLCSARLNVFLFMAGALFSARSAGLVVFSLYVISFAAALLTALLFRQRFAGHEPLLLELPPYRFPTARQVFGRAWAEVRHFWIFARRFIVIGVVAVWWLNNLPVGVEPASAASLSGQLGRVLQPVLAPIGLDPQLSVALVFGFLAKEVVLGGLAVIYNQADPNLLGALLAQKLHWTQAYSFMLFTLLYTPCLSTVAVLKQESRSNRFTALAVGWSLGLAWLASFVFYQGARLLGLGAA